MQATKDVALEPATRLIDLPSDNLLQVMSILGGIMYVSGCLWILCVYVSHFPVVALIMSVCWAC